MAESSEQSQTTPNDTFMGDIIVLSSDNEEQYTAASAPGSPKSSPKSPKSASSNTEMAAPTIQMDYDVIDEIVPKDNVT